MENQLFYSKETTFICFSLLIFVLFVISLLYLHHYCIVNRYCMH